MNFRVINYPSAMKKICVLICLSAFAVSLQAQQILFEDNFNSFSTAKWSFVTPAKWQVELLDGDPALHLKTPQPECSGDCNEFARTKEREFDNFTLDVDIRIENTTYQNYFIQFGGGYYLQFQFEGVKLYRGDPFGGEGGLFYETFNNYVTPGKTYHITLIRELPRIRLLVDGREEFSIEDSFFPTGAIDIGSFKGTVWIDNVVISLPGDPTPPVFSDDFENGTAFWQPQTPSRWQLVADEDDSSYAITTSDYTSPDGQRPGEYSLLAGKIFEDFEFSLTLRTDAREIFNNFADAVLIFAWQDSLNYAYLMLNRRSNETALYQLLDGVREPLLPVADYFIFGQKRYSVAVQKVGDQVRAFIDGEMIFSTTVPGLPPGQLGIGSFNDAVSFDDVIIRNAPAGPVEKSWSDHFEDGSTGNWELGADWQPEIHFANGLLSAHSTTAAKTLARFSPANGPAEFPALTFSGRIRLFGERYFSGAGEAGIRFCDNGDSYYELTFNADRFATRLRRVEAGVETDIANVLYSSPHIDDEEWHEVEILRYGDRIEVFLDHRRLFYTVDSSLSAGSVALFAANVDVWFDNLFLSPIAAVPSRAPASFLLESISADRGDTLAVPLYATVYPELQETTVTLRYDDAVVRFLSAEPGADASGFAFENPEPGPIVVPDIPGAQTVELLRFVSGSSSGRLTRNAEIARLRFVLEGEAGTVTPLIIGPATTLRDGHQVVYSGSELMFNNGSLSVVRDPIRLSGKVSYFSGSKPMPDITIEARAGATQTQVVSAADGRFSLPKLDVLAWTIRPKTTARAASALSTEDVSLLLGWLGYSEELQPGQLLAADATNDGAVRGSDAMAVLRFLAGFPTFTGQTSEFGFDPLESEISTPGRHELSFTAFVRGDVDGSYGAGAGKQGVLSDVLHAELSPEGPDVLVRLRTREPARGFRTVFSFDATGWEPVRVSADAHFRAAINDEEQGKIVFAAAAADYAEPGTVLAELQLRRKRPQAGAGFSLTGNSINGRAHADIVLGQTEQPMSLPDDFSISQSTPNPFSLRKATQVSIELRVPDGAEGVHTLALYDLLGRRVHILLHGELQPGVHRIRWDGRTRAGHELAPGVYFYLWQTPEFSARKKMLIVR